jgi:hypothetical protein
MIVLKLFAFTNQPGAIEYHNQRACGMHRRREYRWDFAERGQRHATDDKGNSEQKVLVDDRAGAAGQFDKERQSPKVIVHQSDCSAVNSNFATGRAHRNPDVAGGQSWRVIDAIADHCDLVTLCLYGFNELDLVLGQTLAFGFFAPYFFSDATGDRLPITRDHRDSAHAILL